MIAFENEIDLKQLPARLKKMSDTELLRYRRSARYMCTPEANLGKPPRKAFVIQLREVREEWRRRHPEPPLSDSI
jgi:hypothetical protein